VEKLFVKHNYNMGLTFDQLKKKVGKNLKYYSDVDGWKTSRDVTETDIGDFINEIYRDIIFPQFATQYPADFKQTAYTDSHIVTATVDASSTASTLVATSSIFTNGMVGLNVYNSTDSESLVISGYTNATTITLESAINNTWDGDTIYVLGKEFTLGGDASDLYVVETVGVKYDINDGYFRQAERRLENDFFQNGNESGYGVTPSFYTTTITVAGVATSAIGIIPQFTTKIDKGLQITYVRKPAVLTLSGDVLKLPVDTPVVYGATARAYEMKREFQESGYWTTKFEMEKKRSISQYRPLSSGRDLTLKIPRRYGNIFYRNR